MRRIWIGVMVTGLLGCAATSPVPEDHFYRLQAPQPEQSLEAPRVPLLAVEALDSDGLHRQRALLYSEDPGQRSLKQYHYHFWRDAPPRLVQDYLTAWLRGTGLAGEVVEGYSGEPDVYRIQGRLWRFEQVTDGAQVRVVVHLELWVRGPGGRAGLFREDYRVGEVVTGTGILATVTAFERALARVGGEFTLDLTRYLDNNTENRLR